MAKKTYSEKLKDPRWQKRRLEILSRSDFTCEDPGCGNKEETLHVHHLDYLSNAEPWEYPDEYLMVLCESCHTIVSEFRPLYEKEIIKNYRLKIKDNYLQHVVKEVFKKYDNLDYIFFALKQLEDDQAGALQALRSYIESKKESTI